MIQLLRKMWFGMFPIGNKRAIKIAMRSRAHKIRQCQAFEALPFKMNIYLPHDEPFWYVTAPWNDGLNGSMLRSSRIIIVSKKPGRVLYDGSASDEG